MIDIYEMSLGTNTFENWSRYGMAMTSSLFYKFCLDSESCDKPILKDY